MVWSYVELKAHEILCSVDPNYWLWLSTLLTTNMLVI
jgi:hypothetical protein